MHHGLISMTLIVSVPKLMLRGFESWKELGVDNYLIVANNHLDVCFELPVEYVIDSYFILVYDFPRD